MADIIDLEEFSKKPGDEIPDRSKLELQAVGLTANPILAPATITTRSDGKQFQTHDLETVHYDRIGLYARGNWTDDEETQRDVLFLWDDVARIEYDFSKVREILQANDEELTDP